MTDRVRTKVLESAPGQTSAHTLRRCQIHAASQGPLTSGRSRHGVPHLHWQMIASTIVWTFEKGRPCRPVRSGAAGRSAPIGRRRRRATGTWLPGSQRVPGAILRHALGHLQRRGPPHIRGGPPRSGDAAQTRCNSRSRASRPAARSRTSSESMRSSATTVSVRSRAEGSTGAGMWRITTSPAAEASRRSRDWRASRSPSR